MGEAGSLKIISEGSLQGFAWQKKKVCKNLFKITTGLTGCLHPRGE
jgi:hypothetical protein